ncbi:hypothetical protein [Ralstonia pseudosolanacearum]|uniref:hypothetical protein n=1 Tax=Ralstonia pseudosolanacearum TaxID=1310165 RepID=UPI0023DBF8CC|nr:hypothetical protein [Ralstonia pseudosolanacearum]
MNKRIASFALIGFCIISHGAFCQDSPGSLHASALQGNQSAHLIENLEARIDSAKTATLYIAPAGWFFLTALSEESLKINGCKYETDDPVKIINIINIIKKSNPRITSTLPSDFEPRESIYLDLINGGRVGFLLDLIDEKENKVGGLMDGQSIKAEPRILGDLYQWAEDLPPVKKCANYIEKYKNK